MNKHRIETLCLYIRLNYANKTYASLKYGFDALDQMYTYFCLTDNQSIRLNDEMYIYFVLSLLKDGTNAIYDPIKDLNYSFEVANPSSFGLFTSIDEYHECFLLLIRYLANKKKELTEKRQVERCKREILYKRGQF